MPFDGTSLSQLTMDLIAARQLLLDKGWVPRCGSGTYDGPNCLLTANATIAFSSNNAVETARRVAMLNAIAKAIGLGTMEIVKFNDSRKNIDEVIAVYDKAIAETLP